MESMMEMQKMMAIKLSTMEGRSQANAWHVVSNTERQRLTTGSHHAYITT
jgi:hypothetical protein